MKSKCRILMVLCTAIMAVCALTGCGKKKINLNDYVNVTFSGYNGAGTAEMDAVAIMADAVMDNWEIFGLTEGQRENANSLYGNSEAYLFLDNASVSLDRTSGLSNGDIVTVHWEADYAASQLEKELDVEFEYSDLELTVSDLEDAQPWDAFENLEISYEGIAPYCYANICLDLSDVSGLSYRCDKNYELSNGDIITITLYAPDDKDVVEYCNYYGKLPNETSKQIVVDGAECYVTDITQIPDETMEKLDNQVRDSFEASTAKWVWQLDNMELLGNYLLTLKDGFTESYSNYLYFVYRITAKDESTGDSVSYYYYGTYQNLILLPDKTISVNMSGLSVPTGNKYRIIHGNVYFIGYEDLESLFNDCVKQRIGSYEYTSTVVE